jgi:phage shock protein E
MNWLPLTIVVIIVLYLGLLRVKASTPEAAVEFLEAGALLVDVRTPGEFAENSVPGSVNYPLSEIESQIAASGAEKDGTILVFCWSGRRSGIAMEKLKVMGYTSVINLGSFGNAMKAAELRGGKEK